MSLVLPDVSMDAFASPFISPFSKEGAASDLPGAAAPASATYGSANRAYYYPIYLPVSIVVRRLWWLNGSTASTNNIQIGLYAPTSAQAPGNAVIRGTSTLASGANVVQFDNITDTAVAAGSYWLAVWCNGTTTTLFRKANSESQTRPAVCYIESSLTGGLPSTASASTAGSNGIFYVFGLTTRATP